MCYTLVVSGKQNNNKNRRDEMKYKLITTRKDGRFSQSLTFDTIEEAERFGYNHTELENMFCNYIPIKYVQINRENHGKIYCLNYYVIL